MRNFSMKNDTTRLGGLPVISPFTHPAPGTSRNAR